MELVNHCTTKKKTLYQPQTLTQPNLSKQHLHERKKNREMGDKKLLVHKRYFRHTKNTALPRLNHLPFKKRPTAKKSQQAVDLIYTLKAFPRSYPPQHLCSSQSLQEQSHFTTIFPHRLFIVVKKHLGKKKTSQLGQQRTVLMAYPIRSVPLHRHVRTSAMPYNGI